MTIKALCVVGARPNYMKIAPILRCMEGNPAFQPTLVHTGQHYDASMYDVFFHDLNLPRPDIWMGVGSGSHAEQTARVMLGFEPVLLEYRPDVVIVVGDVNSTLACTLVAVKLGVPVAHVEAGLRSFDRTMPEEINRLCTDALADLLFTPSEDGDANLLREGIPPDRIHRVGNVMVNSLLAALPLARSRSTVGDLGLDPKSYALMTLHRPSNVDSRQDLERLTDLVLRVTDMLPMVLPMHPRTAGNLRKLGLLDTWQQAPHLHVLEPQGYLDFLALMDGALCLLTDSGGIQEETTILNIPCLTLRSNTERPITVEMGTNTLVGDDMEAIVSHLDTIMARGGKRGTIPPLWDGHVAERIVEVLCRHFLPGPSGNSEADAHRD